MTAIGDTTRYRTAKIMLRPASMFRRAVSTLAFRAKARGRRDSISVRQEIVGGLFCLLMLAAIFTLFAAIDIMVWVRPFVH
jgi:hypothetical protein